MRLSEGLEKPIPGCCPLCVGELQGIAEHGAKWGARIPLSMRIGDAARRMRTGTNRAQMAAELEEIAAVIRAAEQSKIGTER